MGRLQDQADAVGITQQQLAAALEVGQSTVSRWFAADLVPARHQRAIAALLGVRVGWVAGETGKVTNDPALDEAFADGYQRAVRDMAAALTRLRPDGDEPLAPSRGGAAGPRLVPPSGRAPSPRRRG